MREKLRQSTIGLYFRYLRILALSIFQYKGWMLGLLPNMVYVLTDPLDALLMFDRFGSVGEWTLSRVLLVYGIALLSFGLTELFFRGIDFFPGLVRTGSFDRILLRPRPPLMQAMALRFHMNRLNRVVGAALLIAFTLPVQKAVLSPENVLMLLLAIIGGVLCYAAILLVFAAIAFFTVASLEMVYIFTNGSYQTAKVPPQYLPDWMRRTFTFVMPMFLFAYYPAAAVCGWGEKVWMGWIALPVCAAFFALAYLFWCFGVRHYKSTGS